ncbi:unnamed protein product [Brassica oleracea var. botrytis]
MLRRILLVRPMFTQLRFVISIHSFFLVTFCSLPYMLP